MGAGASASRPPECPPDYDSQKFRDLLKMFDNLDTDGSMSLSSEDGAAIVQLARVAVDRKMACLMKDYNTNIAYIEKEEQDRRALFEKELDIWKSRQLASVSSIMVRHGNLKSMCDKQKCDVLLGEMGSKDGEPISWDQFFNYMKTRY